MAVGVHWFGKRSESLDALLKDRVMNVLHFAVVGYRVAHGWRDRSLRGRDRRRRSLGRRWKGGCCFWLCGSQGCTAGSDTPRC